MLELHQDERPVVGKIGRLYVAIGLFSLVVGTAVSQGNPPTPSAAEQQKLLEAMRQYAEVYLSNLPNFLCTQITEQFSAGKNTARWHRGDTLTSRLAFNQGREERRLELVNDKPARYPGPESRRPLITEGEFGMLLQSILEPASAASFSWKGWETVQGKRVGVFDFSVDKQHSRLNLSLSDLAHAVVAYHGSIYADPDSGAVWQVINAITEIPAEVRTKTISTTIEYGETAIGDATYLLPLQASVTLFTGSRNLRNEIQFRNYRRFETDSTIFYRAAEANAGSDTPR